MASKGYTTQAKVEAYSGIDVNASASIFDAWLEAVEGWIDRYCGTTFADAGSDATKYYDGNGTAELIIDPITAITTLQIIDDDGNVDDTLTEGHANDFLLYPYNDTEKTKIVLTQSASTVKFRSGRRRVLVTGRFRSNTAVPKPIELAATKLLAAITDPQSDVKSETLGEYSVSFDAIDEKADAMGVYNLLDQFKVYTL